MTLSPQQRTRLLAIARNAIGAIHRGEQPAIAAVEERLLQPAGAFVTLSDRDGALRGCIGSIRAVLPLAHAVSTSAINAAFHDPRFPPVAVDELPSLHIEISVMGPVIRVQSVEEIVIGRDGLIVTQGPRSGLLLPQVASEYGWTLEEFLAHTCNKAALNHDAWRSQETWIERFSAEIFSE